MPLNSSSVHSLRRVFMQAFVVHDIAEPLVSFDDFASTKQVLALMKAHRFEVVGIRREGRVEGYVESADLGDGVCADYVRPFDDTLVVSSTLPLPDLVLRFREHRRLFISIFGSVGGIVSRTDLDKPPVRMWLLCS